MKVQKIARVIACHAVLVILPCGCGSKEGATQHEAGHAEGSEQAEKAAGVSFSEKNGLEVPEETAKFIGLEVADVEERKVTSSFRFEAQVYRTAQEAQFASVQPHATITALASGFVGEGEAALLKVGQAVSVESQMQQKLTARVTEINPALGKVGGQTEVLLAIQDEKGALSRGTALNVNVPTGTEKTVVSVPISALLKTADGHFVYTLSGEHFVRTPVKLGVVNHEFAEVTDGLLSGDQVVVKPVMTLWMAELQAIRGGKACADGH